MKKVYKKYHYFIGIGYNKTKVEVDAIFELTPKEIKQGIILGFANRRHPKVAEYQGYRLRLRFAMCDEIHIETECKLKREDIVAYVNSLSIKRLEEMIKDNKMRKRREKKKSIIRGDAQVS
jgi:hypothetical protein